LREIQFCRGERPWLLLDLTMAQLKAMMLIVQSGGVRSRELADGLGIAPSAATPLVDRLVEQKLARREDDADDRRIIWIRPTAKARALHDQLLHTNQEVLSDVVEALPPEVRPRVQESVRLLLESAERVLRRQ
jgi:DNA-binding MarR family transcriptional regulator